MKHIGLCGSNKFYFDSFEVQPPSELIAYLKSPIFYNSERVQQNAEVFCGQLRLFALNSFRGEIIFKL